MVLKKKPSNKMTAHKTHFLQNHETNMSNIVRSRLSLYACENSPEMVKLSDSKMLL